jgi:adenosylmethionine-8-amino-7-oxononanoate aminotransferase
LASIAEIEEHDLPRRARELGSQVWHKLEAIQELGIVGEVRGKGLLIGIEFVKNPATKEKFQSDVKFGLQVGKRALENGLLLRFDPDWIAVAPPLVISEAEVDQMMDILTQSVKDVLQSLKSKV